MAESSDHDSAFAEATRVLRDDRTHLTPAMKELILDHFARNLDDELTEARHLWEAGEPLDQKQQTAILGWFCPLVNHAKSTNKRLVPVKEPKVEVKVRARGGPDISSARADRLWKVDREDSWSPAQKRSPSPDSESVARVYRRRLGPRR
jgi:hypothetical protein